jgi:hypothetical protein
MTIRKLQRISALAPAILLLALLPAATASADSASVVSVTPSNPNNGQATYAVNMSMTVTDCGTSRTCSWRGAAKVMPTSYACDSGRSSVKSRYVWTDSTFHTGPGSTSGSGEFTPLPSSLGDPPWRICIYKSLSAEYTTLADYVYTPPYIPPPQDTVKMGEITPVTRNGVTKYEVDISVTVNNCEGSSACAWHWFAKAMPASSTCDTGRNSSRSTYIKVGGSTEGPGTSSGSGSFSAGSTTRGLGDPPWRICVYKSLKGYSTLLDQLYTPPKSGAVTWVTPHITMSYTKGRFKTIRLLGMSVTLRKDLEMTVACTQGCPAGVGELARVAGDGSEKKKSWRKFRPNKTTKLQVTISSKEQVGMRRDYRVVMTRGKPEIRQVGGQVCLRPGSATETVSCP